MKRIVIVLFLLSARLSYSQSYKQLPIQLIEENRVIDSLMDISIRLCHAPKKYFALKIFNYGHAYTFYIIQLKSRKAGILYPTLQPQYMKAMGYFIYKKYTVFVAGDIGRDGLINLKGIFKKVNKVKRYNLIDSSDCLFITFFEYHDGQYIQEGLPIRDRILPVPKRVDSL